jgi:hypothetical protein
MPPLCGLSEDAGDHVPLDAGTRMLLSHHRSYGGDDPRAPGMDADVGSETAVTPLAGVDREGCPGVWVEDDGDYWLWRVGDLTQLP